MTKNSTESTNSQTSKAKKDKNSSSISATSSPAHTKTSHTSISTKSKRNANKVEFRFLCSPTLRTKMNERLKLLNLERSQIMVGFLQEWLKQTDEFLTNSETKES